MSETQESPDDVDLDPEAAMREMMGFSSFTTRPKNRSDASASQTLPQGPATVHPSTGSNSIAVGIFNPLDRPHTKEQHPMTSSTAETPTSLASQNQYAYAFTSPQTEIAYTRQELQELMNGKVNERGDKVYFKPGFVDEDPWSRLRKKEVGGDGAGGSRGKRSREDGMSAEAGH
ncbi:hypothetical protein H2200_005541 [Cladophialophora chaetospira]|uniref:Uncharacterized protein n=1 Tax=Cladophialophora chaetospira TaxID=386627 RepID=A0AA38XC95_9EURO|nr:hypothetical protein H2200_005541 [Cladophialophora chaetospira]